MPTPLNNDTERSEATESGGQNKGPDAMEPKEKLHVAQFRNKTWILSILLAIVTVTAMMFAWWNLKDWFSPKNFAIAVGATGLLLFLAWKIPKWQVDRHRQQIQPKDQVELEIQARATLIQIVGGVALLLSIAFTAVNLRLTAKGVQTTEDNLKYARQTQIAERYVKGVENLMNPDPGIRRSGIYTLGILAEQQESREDFLEQIMLVLAADVRQRSKLPEKYECRTSSLEPIASDIQEILTIIGKQKKADIKLNLARTNLTDAHFEDGNFDKVDFGKSCLKSAHFDRANLQAANFAESCLTEASFNGAMMAEANLTQAILNSASFNSANLQSAKLGFSEIQDAIFNNADLVQADFGRAKGIALFGDVKLHPAQTLNPEIVWRPPLPSPSASP